MKNRVIDSFLLTMLIVSRSFSQGSIIMQPFLQAVTPNSISVLIESSSTATVIVDFGRTIFYTDSAKTASIETTSASTSVHNVRLSGLSANSLYHYRARQGFDASADLTFRTAAEPGTPFRFAWMADFRTNTQPHDAIAARVAAAHPVVSLYGGDLASTGGYSDLKAQFFRPNELALIGSVPFFNATGNHERWTTNTMAFTDAPTSPSGTQDYFSFDYGDMHVLVLNTQLSCAVGSPQYTFAASDLPSSTKQWKVVIAHNHPYCAGGHGENASLKTMAVNLFNASHVDVMFSGHSHFYQHNLVEGIHYMILGSVGAPLVIPGTAPYVVKSLQSYSYGIVDVSPTEFHLDVYNEAGAILDSLILTKPAVGVALEGKVPPWRIELLGNYPNPFNPVTVVSFELPVANIVRLAVYDLLGREVAVLVDERKVPGRYEVKFDAAGLASGMYLYQLAAGNFIQTRKMILVR